MLTIEPHPLLDIEVFTRSVQEIDRGYWARPSIALERIEVMKDGRIAYRIKNPRRGRAPGDDAPRVYGAAFGTYSPASAAADRHHRVFSSRSSYRPLIVPKPPEAHRACGSKTKPAASEHESDVPTRKATSSLESKGVSARSPRQHR